MEEEIIKSLNKLSYNELRTILKSKGVQMERCPPKISVYTQLFEILKKEKIEARNMKTTTATTKYYGSITKTTTTPKSNTGDKVLDDYLDNYNNSVNLSRPTRKSILNSSKLTDSYSNSNINTRYRSRNNIDNIINNSNSINNSKNTIEIEKNIDDYKNYLKFNPEQLNNQDSRTTGFDNLNAHKYYKLITEKINFCDIAQRTGFDDSLSFQLVSEYAKFMSLRIISNDLDSTILQPPPMIQIFYKYHILDTKSYFEFIKLINVELNSDPDRLDIIIDDEEENKLLSKRYEHTLNIYKKNFANINNKIWPNNWDQCLALTHEKTNKFSNRHAQFEENNAGKNDSKVRNLQKKELELNELEKQKKLLDEESALLNQKEKVFQNREKDLQNREKDLQNREKDFQNREKDLQNREKDDNDRNKKHHRAKNLIYREMEREKEREKNINKSYFMDSSNDNGNSTSTSTNNIHSSNDGIIHNNNNNNSDDNNNNIDNMISNNIIDNKNTPLNLNNNNVGDPNEQASPSQILIKCQIERNGKPPQTVHFKIGLDSQLYKLINFVFQNYGIDYNFFILQTNTLIIPSLTPSYYNMVNGTVIQCRLGHHQNIPRLP
ncbi:hypothetical protein DICPUDRAFT_83432 [Dictyostelium purpureum]|uniref:Rad60/SUMO-like domain-containing protein n=1 Tax=Dictyostelium purpureum TaxID=5786 RepID=F0ZZI8_DICPU|nr:uncharacterized protein DICPUDRAFT_83432 [Dictyostelium purpureum]EGC30646.1 hypothetical protein DICPUDRAFT_83432 [Dictyostelium purpureum]|eukprot:XP_003292827.1 hypothetical protein DICPUDRAFT_83432 [Dictyostelium purpureum]